MVALLAEGVDRNTSLTGNPMAAQRSPSSRRAWIEILKRIVHAIAKSIVALLAEGVDRNQKALSQKRGKAHVALLAEGVDRNVLVRPVGLGPTAVALLAEGVDRNYDALKPYHLVHVSPSSRRAWIEIAHHALSLVMLGRRPPRGGRG